MNIPVGAETLDMALATGAARASLRLALLTTITLIGCGGKSSSIMPTPPPPPVQDPAPASPGLHFTVSPIDISSLIYITPLGAMAPWGHTLPTDHVYFYHHAGNQPYTPVPVYAPAAG